MLTLNISKADIQRLNYERYNYPDALVQKRLTVLYLKAVTTYSHQEIGKIAGVSRASVSKYIRLYNKEGYEGICKVRYGTNKSNIDEHKQSLLEYFMEHPPLNSTEALHRIKTMTGIQRSPTQIRRWMSKHGLKYLKAGQIPAKADRIKQEQFVNEQLAPLIEQAKNENIHLLFMDAAHFVMGVFLIALWCVKRVFIKSAAGRKRLNVLGAVNAMNQQIHFLTNDTYITATTIVEFLYQIRLYYFDMKPIYIVLDNARYQHCQLVINAARRLGIHLVFLPSYSPNLNIIERLWKWTKKKCLYAQYYDSFESFKNAITHTLTHSNSIYQNELESLLSLNFQLF
jgi:transposase